MKARFMEALMLAGILPWVAGFYACSGMGGGMSMCGAPSTGSQAATCGPSVGCPSGYTCNYNSSPATCQKN